MWKKPSELKIGQTICVRQNNVCANVDCIIELVTEIKPNMFLVEYKNNGRPLEQLDSPTILMSHQKAFVVTLETKIKGLEKYLQSARGYSKESISEIKAKYDNLEEYYSALEIEDNQCQADAYESIGEQLVGA